MAKMIDSFNHSMENGLAKMQEHLNKLAPRDRLALTVLSIFLSVTLIGCLLWFSYHGALRQQQRVTELKDMMTWMQTNAVQFSTQGTELSSVNDKVQRLAQQQGLSVQLQDQQGQVQFVITHQNYAVLASFITQLAQQSVSIVAMDMQKQADGLIQLKAVVQ